MKIPMLNLVKQYENLKSEIDQAINEVLTSGEYILGSKVQEFERNIADYLGARHAIGVASGSDALLLSLHALGIGKGDKVAVPSFTFFATAGAVSRLGACPVFIDIEPDTYNLDLHQLEEKCQEDKGIKAVIPVHLFGLPVDMENLMAVAERYGLYVVEDACQAIDADIYLDKSQTVRKAGTIGHAGCFSFFPSKNLGCYGDGGLIVTDDDHLAEKIRMLRVHGARPKYYHSVVGYNSRLDTLQAAVLNVKLKYLPEWTAKRRKVASSYNEEIKKHGLDRWLKYPAILPGHVFHQYVIETEKRDELSQFLKEKGIATAVYYPLPLHLQKCFAELGYKEGDLKNSERAAKRVLALPIDPELTGEEISYIVRSIKEFFTV